MADDDLAERTGDLEYEIDLLRRYSREDRAALDDALLQLGIAIRERDEARAERDDALTALAELVGYVPTDKAHAALGSQP